MSISRREKIKDTHHFILMLLLNEGKMTEGEILERSDLFIKQTGFHLFFSPDDNRQKHQGRPEKRKQYRQKLLTDIDKLQEKGFLLSDGRNYCLSEAGTLQAEDSRSRIMKSASFIRKQINNPIAASRNTIFIDAILAIIKLIAGIMSGSAAMLADAADACLDTLSAVIVWIGVRAKRELPGSILIIILIFATSLSIAYTSGEKVISIFFAGAEFEYLYPWLVISVELIALLFASLLFYYQRYIGLKNKSLSLIIQSVDSRNHIFVSMAVILGAICSFFNLLIVDAIIGLLLSIRMFIDGVGLIKELINSRKDENPDYSHYESFIFKKWNFNKEETFKTWMLFTIFKRKSVNRDALIDSLEITFKTPYVPIYSEYSLLLGKNVDFDAHIDEWLDDLIRKSFVQYEDGFFILAEEGLNRIEKLRRMRGIFWPGND